MCGIGPMLPVIPAAEKGDRSSTIRNRQSKHNPGAESHELIATPRTSIAETERTLFDDENESVATGSTPTPHHQRDLSLIVDFDLEHAATQLRAGDISDLELALFAFWIKAKHGNYLMAKGLIRELSLDQGYNVHKITNPCVRRLLQEVHEVRPRDPRHALDWNSPFHGQTRQSSLRTKGSTRTVGPPLTPRLDTLPPSLRLKREHAVQEAARSTMTSNNAVDYPPNTPDRPAPLSVKSRSSRMSSSPPRSYSILRSVSTPIRAQAKDKMRPSSRRSSALKAESSETLNHLSVATVRSSCRSTGDVFGGARSTDQSNHNSFADILRGSQERRYGTPGKYMYRDAGGHTLGPYQLDVSDAASESSCGTFMSFTRKNKSRASTGKDFDAGIIGDESFDALESYIGSEEEDEGSILESASTVSEEAPTQYRFAAQALSPQPVVAGPVPSSPDRRATVEARRKVHASPMFSQALNFHRPLPLRSYESEASLFPTAGSQANSGRNRSKSVSSFITSSRPAAETMAMPSLTAAIQVRTSLDEIESELYEPNNFNTKISEHTDQDTPPDSQRSSSGSTLAAFPIPPMGNPVGELPMLVSRAASSPQSRQTASAQQQVVPSSVEDAYRAIVKVNMATVLERTRRRGKKLQTVDWDKLTSFERAWREMNSLLLETIYGRNDIVLEGTDVAYIDCVAREFRNDSVTLESPDWVRQMFEAKE